MSQASSAPGFPWVRTIAAWFFALLIFFPLLWLALTAFKTEGQAIASELFFKPTLSSFVEVQQRSDYLHYAKNSLITSVVSTVLGLLIAAPAAYSMAFFRTPKTRDILMWMLSTKMMPAVGVLVPIYLIFKTLGLLDNAWGLMIVLMLMNLPIVVWMLYTYFKELPVDILEAARMDGATLGRNWSTCWCRWPCPASPRHSCSTSSWPGTRPSGRST